MLPTGPGLRELVRSSESSVGAALGRPGSKVFGRLHITSEVPSAQTLLRAPLGVQALYRGWEGFSLMAPTMASRIGAVAILVNH